MPRSRYQQPMGIAPSLRKFLPLLLIAFVIELFIVLRSLSGGSGSNYNYGAADSDSEMSMWMPISPDNGEQDLYDDELGSASMRGGKVGRNTKIRKTKQKTKKGNVSVSSTKEQKKQPVAKQQPSTKEHKRKWSARVRQQPSVSDEPIDHDSSSLALPTKKIKATPSHEQKSNNRVYCMVPFIWTPSALHAYHAIHASWGKRCHILRFFIDPVIGDDTVGFYDMSEASQVLAARRAKLTLPNDVVILHDMRRPWHTCNSKENKEKNKPIGNCRNIFEKVWRMMVYVGYGTGGSSVGESKRTTTTVVDDDEQQHDTDAYGAEWFVKVDSDTFLFPENVGHYVEARQWSHNDHHYFGHVLNHRKSDRGVGIVAGGAVFYSRAALLAAGDAFRTMPMEKGDKEEDGTCRDAYTGTEEVVTAVCLKEHSNILAEPALDPEGREEVALYEVDDLLDYNRTEQGEWWFWEGKQHVPCHDEGDCLAHLPLAFHHYKDSTVFLDFEKEFHGSVMYGEEDSSLIRKNDGRIAARHWPRFDRVYRYFERIRAAMKAAGTSQQVERLERRNARNIPAMPAEKIRRISSTTVKKQPTSKHLPTYGVQKIAKHTQQRNRVYCMVPFIWTPSAIHAYHAIHASWGKRCDILRFFIDPVIGDETLGYYNMTEPSEASAAKDANAMPPGDVVILHDMRRPWHTCSSIENKDANKPIGNCRNIFEKVWRMMVYVGYGPLGSRMVENENENTDAYKAEWFVKVDSDTFLFPENVGRYVKSRNWSYDDHHYFGHVLNHRNDHSGVSIVAGGAVFYSRTTLLAAGDAFSNMPMDKGDEEEDGTCRDAYTGTEEVVTAVCLKEHSNVLAEPAIDPEGREQVALYEVDDLLTYNRTEQGEWWFWENKQRFPCHDEGDCLAHLPLAFHHYKDSQVFLDFEKEFYGSVMKGAKDDTLVRKGNIVAARHWPNFDRTHKYFEQVRTAMKAAEFEDSQSLAMLKGQQNSEFKNRLYCMVPFIWSPKYVPSYHAIHKTWGKRCDILKFMIDPIIGGEKTGFLDLRNNTDYKLPEDVVVISDMQRDWHHCIDGADGNCRNIWEKIWRSWIWVDTHGDSDLADWFVKIDADSYLFPENLKHYVNDKGWSPDEHHYFGHILKHKVNDGAVPMIAGAAVFFSRATMKAAANIYRGFERSDDAEVDFWEKMNRCKDAYTDQEEVITSVCLKDNLGVDADPALDEMGQELVSVGEIEDVLLWNRTEQGEWWYWKNKPSTHPKTGKDNMHYCCGDLPITFHGYKDPRWFFKLEQELYSTEVADVGNRWKKYEWKNPKETKIYFDRVRKAMKDVSNNIGS